MRGNDQGNEGEKGSNIDILVAAIAVMLPDRFRQVGRCDFVKLGGERELSLEQLEPATMALDDPQSDREVDSKVVLELLSRIERLGHKDIDVDDLRARVMAHAERRWTVLAPQLAREAVENYQGHQIIKRFPRLQADPHFLARLTMALSDKKSQGSWLVELLAELSIASSDSARKLIVAAQGRDGNEVSTALFGAIARDVGWTPWVSLMAILHVRPDYAEPDASFEVDTDPTRASRLAIAARLEMARALETQTKVRAVAAMLLELTPVNASWNDRGLLARPAETRAAYVESLKTLIGEAELLRRSVVEALLWLPTNRAADLAQFAAAAITEAEDRDFLIDLEQYGVPLVQYGARAVRAVKFSDRLETGELPTPGGLVQGLTALEIAPATIDEPARTWLGNRNIERLIEDTIARVETKIATGYDRNGDQGEDRHLSSLFAVLAERFSDLDTALEAMARATSAPDRAAVAMRYRNVDRSEEGDKGIKGAKRFSADLCLIVDPILNGTSLGRRVTLVQAKRIYRNRKAKTQPAWERSFQLDRKQRLALQQQCQHRDKNGPGTGLKRGQLG